MTAKEIRQMSSVGDGCMALLLRELTAQVAELNESIREHIKKQGDKSVFETVFGK